MAVDTTGHLFEVDVACIALGDGSLFTLYGVFSTALVKAGRRDSSRTMRCALWAHNSSTSGVSKRKFYNPVICRAELEH